MVSRPICDVWCRSSYMGGVNYLALDWFPYHLYTYSNANISWRCFPLFINKSFYQCFRGNLDKTCCLLIYFVSHFTFSFKRAIEEKEKNRRGKPISGPKNLEHRLQSSNHGNWIAWCAHGNEPPQIWGFPFVVLNYANDWCGNDYFNAQLGVRSFGWPELVINTRNSIQLASTTNDHWNGLPVWKLWVQNKTHDSYDSIKCKFP